MEKSGPHQRIATGAEMHLRTGIRLFRAICHVLIVSSPALAADKPAGLGVPFILKKNIGGAAYSQDKHSKQLVCYSLEENSAASYNLVPSDEDGCWNRHTSNNKTALEAGDHLWIRIAALPDYIDLIYLNVSANPALPIIINALRTSQKVGFIDTKAAALTKYYFAWPYPLRGDTIPTVTVTAFASKSSKLDTTKPYDLGSDLLDQVHQPSRFNLNMGVVYNTIRTPTFGYTSVAPIGTQATPTAGAPKITGYNPIIDPVVFLTYYPHPIDAERDWDWPDLIPGVSLGFSLSAPTANYYIGGMSEFPGVRGIQIVYGLSIARVNALPDPVIFQALGNTQNLTPVLVQHYQKGGYVGLSFNISGFVSLMTGGKGP